MIRTPLFPILILTLSTAACDLATTEIDANIRVTFQVDATENAYTGDFVVDPNDNADVRNNRDRIKSGEVTDITLEIIGVDMANAATSGDARLYFRKFSTDTWPAGSEGEPLVSAGTTAIAVGTTIPVTPDAMLKTELANILFADSGETKVDMRFTGMADAAPVKFTGQATFKVVIKAGL